MMHDAGLDMVVSAQTRYVMAWHLRRKPTGIKRIPKVKSIKPIKPVKPVKAIRPIKPVAPVGHEYYWRD